MKRTPIRAKRKTPRRREAPRWTFDEWQEANRVLAVRSGGCCEWCGRNYGPFERHHRKRRRDGGDRLANILLLCRDCHHHTTEHPLKAREAGLIVSVSRDPAEVPFLQLHRNWVWLDDAGNATPFFEPMPTGTDAHDVWA